MSITTAQIRGARGILNWSQQDLAQRTGISATSIGSIENGQTTPRASTIETIRKTLENASIEFIGMDGVKQRDETLTVLERKSPEDNVYLRLMDDIFYTVRDKKTAVLFSFVNQALAPKEVVSRQGDIRELGVDMRFLIQYGDDNLRYPAKEYKYLPEGKFLTNPCVVYGDKYAVMVKDLERIIIIKDEKLAQIKRTEFDIIWEYSPGPDKSVNNKKSSV